MRQLSTIFLIIFLSFGLIRPVFGTIRGGIDYRLPIDYSNLSETQIENKARTYYMNAMRYKDREENEELTNALMLYTVLQNINPESIEYCCKLGILYDKAGKDRQAKGNFGRAIGINQNSPIPYFYYGEFYYKRQIYRKALKYYKEAYKRGYNRHYDTLYKLGDIYEKYGDTRSSLKYLREAFIQSPNDILNNKIMKVEEADSINKEYYSDTRIRN